MATNFDATRLAVQTAFPTNDLLFDDKEMPSIHVFIPKFRLFAAKWRKIWYFMEYCVILK